LLHGRRHDLLGRAVEPRVADVHARVAQAARDDLRAAVVTVETDLGDEDADGRDRSASLIQDSGPGIKDAATAARGRGPPDASAAASLRSPGARAPRRLGWQQLEQAAALSQRVAVQAEHPGGTQLVAARQL